MTIHSSLTLTLTTALFALVLVGCAATYPETPAGRSCRHEREVCGRAAVFTAQECLNSYEIAASMFPGCRAQIDAQNECLVRAGSAGCDSSTACTAEREAFITCRDNGGMGGGV